MFIEKILIDVLLKGKVFMGKICLILKGNRSGGKAKCLIVLEEGVEPSRGCPHRFLRPACMPFHHSSKILNREKRSLHLYLINNI